MRGKIPTYLFLAVSLIGSGPALAANPEAAKATATGMCAACHGAKGISTAGTIPNLAGQKEEYLASALKSYRDKTRNAPLMNNMAVSLKDDDIANLAAYFAALKPGE
jgi:cytochrome c553